MVSPQSRKLILCYSSSIQAPSIDLCLLTNQQLYPERVAEGVLRRAQRPSPLCVPGKQKRKH